MQEVGSLDFTLANPCQNEDGSPGEHTSHLFCYCSQCSGNDWRRDTKVNTIKPADLLITSGIIDFLLQCPSRLHTVTRDHNITKLPTIKQSSAQ